MDEDSASVWHIKKLLVYIAIHRSVFARFKRVKTRNIYMYINIENRKKTTLSSRQACFVITHSSGDFKIKIP